MTRGVATSGTTNTVYRFSCSNKDLARRPGVHETVYTDRVYYQGPAVVPHPFDASPADIGTVLSVPGYSIGHNAGLSGQRSVGQGSLAAVPFKTIADVGTSS